MGSYPRKWTVMGVMIVLHGLAIAGLMNANLSRGGIPEEEQAIEVVLNSETPPEAPRQPGPQLQPVELRVPSMPQVEVPLVDAAPPATAITVAAPEAPPPRFEVPDEDVDAPVSVDQVEYLSRVLPRYPMAARRARAEGTVYLRILIDREGLPREVRVHRSCGHDALDDAAVDAVRRFRFKPHRVNGTARNVQAIVPIEFSLSVRTVHSR